MECDCCFLHLPFHIVSLVGIGDDRGENGGRISFM